MYLDIKKKKGIDYYYLRQNKRIKGKVVPSFQKYIGTKEKLIELIEQGLQLDLKNELNHTSCFHFGAVSSLYHISKKIDLVNIIDNTVKKRKQDMNVSTYIISAAINRAIKAKSKRSISSWLRSTSLPNLIKNLNIEKMTSQTFWDNMNLITEENIIEMENKIVSNVTKAYDLNLDVLLYDATNYYSYIHTFNDKPTIEKRGKNKQKRKDLRQSNFALLVTKEHHIPLFHKVYEGNINDYTAFQDTISEIKNKKDMLSVEAKNKEFILVFDAGNVSETNINLIEKSKFKFISKLKPSNHKDLLEVDLNEYESYENEDLEDIKTYKTSKNIYGKQKQIVVKYNQAFYEAEYITVINHVNEVKKELLSLETRLKGYIEKNFLPSNVTIKTVENNISAILKNKCYLKKIFNIEVNKEYEKFPILKWNFEENKLTTYCNINLGKTIYFTNIKNITAKEIFETYSFQNNIEKLFKISKNRNSGCWWPKYHWTNQKIKVHAFYCYISLLLQSLLAKELYEINIKDNIYNIMEELHEVNEVVDILINKKGRKITRTRITKLNIKMEKIIKHLNLKNYLKN